MGAHGGQLGRHVATRQCGQVYGFVVDVANAVGHVEQQGGRVGAVGLQRCRALGRVGLGARGQQAGQLRALVGDGRDGLQVAAQQQRHGQVVELFGGGAQGLPQRGQGGGPELVGAQGVHVEVAGQLVVTRLQQGDQHGGEALALGCRGRFEHHVAGGLQVVGQGGLLRQHLAQQGLWVGVGVETLRLGAQDAGEAVDTFGQHLPAVTHVEQVGGQHAPQQVERRTQQEPRAVQADLRQRRGRRRGHREQQGEQQREGQRPAAFAPGHHHHRQEGARHQQKAQRHRVVVQQLHQHEQRRAQQRRGQHLHDLAFARRGHIGQAGDQHPHRRAGRATQPGGLVHQQHDQHQAQGDAEAVGDVLAQRYAQQPVVVGVQAGAPAVQKRSG